MEPLAALVAFSFVSAATPGPNNILLWASGAAFGFRRTLRHVFGTALGLGGMALGVAAGLGALITAYPALQFAMKLAGSVHLVYLAWQVAGTRALERGEVARPLGLVQAAAFQAINPKAWIFAVGAITTFRPADVPVVTGSLLVAGTMMLVIVPSALWAGGGGIISSLAAGERSQRILGIALAALLALTVVSVWL